jgi:hypothetical protein
LPGLVKYLFTKTAFEFNLISFFSATTFGEEKTLTFFLDARDFFILFFTQFDAFAIGSAGLPRATRTEFN